MGSRCPPAAVSRSCVIESAGSAWKYCIGRGITLAKVLIAAMAFATLETEGYGQFIGSIQRAFPHNMMDRSGMEVRAVP